MISFGKTKFTEIRTKKQPKLVQHKLTANLLSYELT